MAETDGRPNLQQLRSLGGFERSRVNARPSSGAQDQRRVTEGLGRRQQHQKLGRLGQLADPLEVVPLDLLPELTDGRKLESAGQLGSGHASRQLQQGKRVAAGLSDDSVHEVAVEPTGHDAAHECAGILLRQPVEMQLGQTLEVGHACRSAHCSHDGHRLRPHSPRDEPEYLA